MAIPPPLPEVIAVEPVLDRWLRLTFAAGDPAYPIVRQYDVDPWLSKGVFRALRDPLLFRQAFIQYGTVCWPGNLDIDPESLWSQSVPWPEAAPCVGVRPTGRSGSRGQPVEAFPEVSLSSEEALELQAAREWRRARQRALRELRGGLPVQPLPLLTVVASLLAVPSDAYGLRPSLPPGTLGTVVEQLDASYCLVDFAGNDGISVGDVPLRYDELLPVHRVREPGASAFGTANRDGGPTSVTALNGVIRQPQSAVPVSLDDMAAAGPAKAVADMKAFFEEGQALAQVSPSSASGSSDDLYETDSAGWAKLQIHLLQAENWAELDVGNLIKELERVAALVRLLRTELGGEPKKARRPLAQVLLEIPEGPPLVPDAEVAGPPAKFMVCISREGLGELSADDLTLGLLYEVISPADNQGMVHVIDDSGEDYLYPVSLFATVEVQESTATRLRALLAARGPKAQQELRQPGGGLQKRASGPPIPLLSTVVTLAPVPNGTIGVSVDLPRGTLGTVVEHLSETIGWVEFAGADGVSVAETPIFYVDLLAVSRASREAAGISVTALKGMAQRPATPVAVEDMNAAGLTARAVADMKAFVQEGRALRQAAPPIPLLAVVATLRPVPWDSPGLSAGMPQGTLGTVVAPLDAATCRVEFAGDDGVSVGELSLRYNEPLRVRRPGEPKASAFEITTCDFKPASVSYDPIGDTLRVDLRPGRVIRDELSPDGLLQLGYGEDGLLQEIVVLDVARVPRAPSWPDPNAAVAAMRAFVEEGQALHHEAAATGDTEAASHQLKAELLQAIRYTELSRAGVHKVLLDVAEQAGEPAIGHVTPVGGNVFADLGFPPEAAARLKAEADTKIDAALAARAAEASKYDHLYEAAPVAWAELQARLLQAEAWSDLDKDHLIEVLGRVADLFREMARSGASLAELGGSEPLLPEVPRRQPHL